MYKHILIPTDGSDLSNKAIRDAIALAKTINAKVTGITVTIPFHVFTMNPAMITDTEELLQETHERGRDEIPDTGERCSSGRRSCLHGDPCRTGASLQRHHRCREQERLRPDRDGFARSPRLSGRRARQRDRQGADPQHRPRSGLSIAFPLRRAFTDAQITTIMALSRPLPPDQRVTFVELLALTGDNFVPFALCLHRRQCNLRRLGSRRTGYSSPRAQEAAHPPAPP